MPPRLLPVMMGALIAASALVACRKEVPPPPVPAPDTAPRPVTLAVYLALVTQLSEARAA